MIRARSRGWFTTTQRPASSRFRALALSAKERSSSARMGAVFVVGRVASAAAEVNVQQMPITANTFRPSCNRASKR